MSEFEIKEHDGRKYVPFTSDYDDFFGDHKVLTFWFCKPMRKQIMTLAKTDKAKQYDATRNVLTGLCHPDCKEDFIAAIDDEPVLVLAFADEVMKLCSMGSINRGN